MYLIIKDVNNSSQVALNKQSLNHPLSNPLLDYELILWGSVNPAQDIQ